MLALPMAREIILMEKFSVLSIITKTKRKRMIAEVDNVAVICGVDRAAKETTQVAMAFEHVNGIRIVLND